MVNGNIPFVKRCTECDGIVIYPHWIGKLIFCSYQCKIEFMERMR